jgi:hypothetical protein
MPVLEGLADLAAEGCLVKPFWYQWVMDPATVFSVNVMVDKPTERRPDGWFHASQHPLAGERELYQWMTGTVKQDKRSYTMQASAMMGSLGHACIESLLDWMGVAVPLPPGECPACGKPRRPLRARPSRRYCTEWGFADEATRARCHLDSILDMSRSGAAWQLGGPSVYGFDFKTIYPMGLSKIPDMNLAFFREKWPHYWAQMQECMRMTGLRQYIVFFLGFGNPWDTKEYHVPFDPEFAAATEAKYRRVLYHVDNQIPVVA